MQHIPHGKQDEHGCFVYRVVESVAVRSACSTGDDCRTKSSFGPGDLVSVDLIRPSRYSSSSNGPFLRLSDCSGWLFEKKNGVLVMEKVDVARGLWIKYADNQGGGIALRRHPFDNSPKETPTVAYWAMQKLYCDCRVAIGKGAYAYRVQGTDGWVFDKRINEDGSETAMLLPESLVHTGLFVYELLHCIGVRSTPSIEEGSKTGVALRPNQLISCDAIRRCPYGTTNGPYVRLSDGSGWAFERKSSFPDPLLQKVPINKGKWIFEVVNSAGIGLRRMPHDDNRIYTQVYQQGERVTCDRQVKSSTGAVFYRVEGSDGWVFEERGDHTMMVLLSSSPHNENMSSTSKEAWNIEFVRGIATSSGLTEVQHSPESRVVAFHSKDGSRINIYYTTRTVGTAIDHPSQGKTQLFRRNCSNQELVDILRDPRTHTGRGYKKRRSNPVVSTQHGRGIVVEEEEELRNAMAELDEQAQAIAQKILTTQKSLKRFDDARAKSADNMESRRQARQAEIKAAEARKRQQAQRRLRELTCRYCGREFVNQHARDQHTLAAHGVSCDVCGRSFNNQHSLDQHCDALGHW